MDWNDFQATAPTLARLGRQRFERTRVAMIATVRDDGSPRISPIEPVLAMGHLLVGAMPSGKVRDLWRDARCSVHSSVCDVNGSEGEFRLRGLALPVDQLTRDGDYDAWWKSYPEERATVFRLDIASAVFVRWDIGNAQLELTRWSTDRGVRVETHPYP